jgi:hypothetical protein
MIIICFALFLNLTGNTCRVHQNVPFTLAAADTIPSERVIPYKEDSSVHDDRKSKYLSNVARNLAIASLENQRNGIYVRIWLWGYRSPNFVITIYQDSSNMGCSAVSWSGKQIDSVPFIVIHDKWNNLVPKSGWHVFFSTLNKYGITTLGNGLSFSQHKGHLTRMSYVQFEIVEDGKYRYYEYLEPSYYRYVEKGSKEVYRFLKYFDLEMNVDVYKTDDKLFEKP